MEHVANDDIITRMLEALEGATSLQLCQLRAVIDGMLADHRRTIAARASLHLGQAVHFVDSSTGQLRHGKVVAKDDTQATVLEEQVRRNWKIPYLAIEGAEADSGATSAAYEPPPEPPPATGLLGFSRGDKVTFDDGRGNTIFGEIAKVKRRTATIESEDGRKWRVELQFLRRVLDV